MNSLKWLLPLVSYLLLSSIDSPAQHGDTTAVRSLHLKAYQFRSTYPDSLLFYRDSSFVLAVAIGDRIGIADSYTDLGIYHWLKGNYKEAINAYDTANQILLRADRPARRMTNYMNLGMVYSRLGDLPRAIDLFYQALRLAESAADSVLQAQIYNSLGVAFKNHGDLDEAAGAYSNALTLFRKKGMRESEAGCNANIGNIFLLRKDYIKALQCQQTALAIFDSVQNVRGLVTCYNNISDVYFGQNQLKQALAFRHKALALSHSKGFYSNEVAALSGIGQIEAELGHYTVAESYFLKGLTLAKERNYRTEMVNLLQGLSKCYKNLGRTGEALRYFEQYSSLKDSLFNEVKLTTISNLQTAYDLERKEAAIKILTRDNQIAVLARNRILLAASVLVGVAFAIVMWQRYKKAGKQLELERKAYDTRIEAERQQLELKRKIYQSEIKALRSQMNPHFIFNCLTTIQNHILTGNLTDATKYVGDFGLLLRKILVNSDYTFIKLKEEISTIELYLHIEALRFDEKFSWKIIVAPNIDVNEIEIPPMLIQPIIENAIHHGLREKSGERTLTIEFFEQARRLVCRIEDNGVGMLHSKKNADRKSKGSVLISDRISVLNHAHLLEATYVTQDLQQESPNRTGTRVELSFDISKLEG